jgi:hypothetical protein
LKGGETDMFELRIATWGNLGYEILEYRTNIAVDVSGAFCPGGWSDWKRVPVIDGSKTNEQKTPNK